MDNLGSHVAVEGDPEHSLTAMAPTSARAGRLRTPDAGSLRHPDPSSARVDGAVSVRKTARPMLEMRAGCERCATTLELDGTAVICSFECTYCEPCGAEMDDTCPNCGGELVARPRRAPST
ncbi:MAG TPA: DUF1272 domain-containing protein [Acidimicrobiales bacterium]|nr:DUF1272 domain-containing protein [Acidimicrobiales bacterium]